MANQPKKYKKFVATAATATLVASAIVPVASAASLSDIAGNTHEAAITSLVDAEIIKGYADGTFKPNKTLTRSDVVKLLGKYLEKEGYAIPSDAVSSPRFSDLSSKSNKELLEYAAVVADAGVFAGSNGKLLAGDPITRENMAIVLVRMVNTLKDVSLEEYVDGQDFSKEVKDLNSAKAEARSAINVLDFYDITTATNFLPKNTVTRGQFATFLNNVIKADFAGASVTGTVKSINNTTVEVVFAESVKDIKDLNFTIEGLEVKNAVVKLTDSKTVTITTAAQEAGKEYTVSLNGNKIGKFVGASAVLPTAIKMTTNSQQAVYGQQVTVKAEVTVAEGQSKAGIPVTFIIAGNGVNATPNHIEVLTNAEGIASHTYTQYTSSVDTVTAYATGKSDLRNADAKVYWSNEIQLKVEEITTGNDLANETKKSYKVIGDENTTYYVAIKENISVAPDKVTQVKVQSHNAVTFVTPYQLTTGANVFATVTTNSKGEGTFTVYGSNLSATPVVYKPESTNNKYTSVALQAQAPTVKYSQIDRLALTVVAEGTASSAQYANLPVKYDTNSAGGRTYTVTVTDKDGKLAPAGTTAYVTFEEGNIAGEVYFSTGTKDFVRVGAKSVQAITVGTEGKAQFRVAGTGATTFVKPTVFLNTAGTASQVEFNKTGAATDIFKESEVTYFGTANVLNALLTVKDLYGRTVTSLNAEQDAVFTYQAVDQNGFAYRPSTTSGSTTQVVFREITNTDGTKYYVQETQTIPGVTVYEYTLAFDVTSTFGDAEVKNALGVTQPAVQNLGNTKTYHVKSDATGKAIVLVTSKSADTVSVNVTGASNILPTQTASVSFVNSTIVPDVYSGTVASYDSIKGQLTFQGKNPVNIFGANIIYTKGNEVIANYDAFIKLLADANGPVSITRTVKDGVTTFNIYNIGTNGGGPVDTATTVTPGTLALNAAKAAATAATAGKVATDFTPASWTDLVTAQALPETTETEKVAKATAINTAVAGLQAASTVISGLQITTFTSGENFMGLQTFTVNGTVATGSATTLEATVTYTDATTSTITITDVTFTGTSFVAKFNELKLADGKTVKSVTIEGQSKDL